MKRKSKIHLHILGLTFSDQSLLKSLDGMIVLNAELESEQNPSIAVGVVEVFESMVKA